MENKILEIMDANNGIVTMAQIQSYGIAKRCLYNMVKKGVVEKIERGIYATKNYQYDEYYVFQLKYPKTIFSHNTALYFNQMTERTPVKLDVSIPKNYNPHRFKNIANVYRMNEEVLELGVIEKTSPQGMHVRVYDLEKTVCDIIKDKDCLDVELRNKAIRKAIKSESFSATKMFEYAKKMNIYDKVKNYMEAILW